LGGKGGGGGVRKIGTWARRQPRILFYSTMASGAREAGCLLIPLRREERIGKLKTMGGCGKKETGRAHQPGRKTSELKKKKGTTGKVRIIAGNTS